MEAKRVVVTGMGVITSLGHTLEDYWQNLLAGKNGIGKITLFDTTLYDTKFAGEITDFDPTQYIDRKEARRMDRFTHFAVIAAQRAVQDSGIDFDLVDRDQFGVIVSCGIGGMNIYEKECQVLLERGPSRVSPFLIPMLIADIAPGYISIQHNLRGPNYATTSACASAAHAIGEAFNHIRYGRSIGFLAGGCEAPICKMGVAGFSAMKALSTRNEEPEKASRPFELNRDGFVMGEGGAVLLLEELEHAKARNAKVYAEITGVGYTADAYHITAPVPGGDGAVRAMQQAMKDANIEPNAVDYINAHGTSTPHNDKTETEAIKKTFGEHAYKLAVSSTKSMIGHLLGASGAAEAVASILSIIHNEIHPTINYEEPDPDCDLYYVPNKPIKRKVDVVLSNSFGFGGHNVTLAFGRYNHQ